MFQSEVKLKKQVIESINTLFQHRAFEQIREEYLEKCFKNIRDNRSVVESLKVSISIMQTFSMEALIFSKNRLQIILETNQLKFDML